MQEKLDAVPNRLLAFKKTRFSTLQDLLHTEKKKKKSDVVPYRLLYIQENEIPCSIASLHRGKLDTMPNKLFYMQEKI